MYESQLPRDYDHHDDGPIDPDNFPAEPSEEIYSDVDQPVEGAEVLLDQPEAGVQYLSGPEDEPEADAAERQPEIADKVEPAHELPTDALLPVAQDAGLPPHLVELLADAHIVLPASLEALEIMAENMAIDMARYRGTLPTEWSAELVDAALELQRKLLHAVQEAVALVRESEKPGVASDVTESLGQEETVIAEMDVPGEDGEKVKPEGDDVASGPEVEAADGGEAPPLPPGGPPELGKPGDDPSFWAQLDGKLNEADRTIFTERMSVEDMAKGDTGPTAYLAIQRDIHDTPEHEDYPARVAQHITEVINAFRGHGPTVFREMPQLFMERLGIQLLAVGDTLEAQMWAIQTLPPQSIGPEERASARARLAGLVESWSEPFELYHGSGDVSPGQAYLELDDKALTAGAAAGETFPQAPSPLLSNTDFSSTGVSNPAFARAEVFKAGLDDMAYRVSREAATLEMLKEVVLRGQLVIELSGKGNPKMSDALTRLIARFEVLEESLDTRMRKMNRFYNRRMPIFGV